MSSQINSERESIEEQEQGASNKNQEKSAWLLELLVEHR